MTITLPVVLCGYGMFFHTKGRTEIKDV